MKALLYLLSSWSCPSSRCTSIRILLYCILCAVLVISILALCIIRSSSPAIPNRFIFYYRKACISLAELGEHFIDKGAKRGPSHQSSSVESEQLGELPVNTSGIGENPDCIYVY